MKKRQYSFRTLIVGVIGLVLLSMLLIFFTVVRDSLVRMTRQSEDESMQVHRTIVEHELRDRLNNLGTIARDIAYWGETASFIDGNNPDYIRQNWDTINPLQSYGITFMLIKDVNSRDQFVEFRDFLREEPLIEPEGFSEYVYPIADKVLSDFVSKNPSLEDAGVEGTIVYDGVHYLFCSVPVTLSDNPGPPNGTVMVGMALTPETLRHHTHLEQAIFEFVDGKSQWLDGGVHHGEGENGLISSALNLRAYFGEEFQLRLSTRSLAYAESKSMLLSTSVLFFAATALVLILLYILMSRMFLRPIRNLGHEIRSLSYSERLNASKYESGLELSSLVESVNLMVDQLDNSSISIKVFQGILNGMDAYIYVTDPDTDEILFMNDKMREHYGLTEDPVGKMCYEVLQSGIDGHCEFCPSEQLLLSPDSSIVWHEHSTLTGRHYRNTDCLIEWYHGKSVHLQHSVDMTQIVEAQAALEKQLEQQELMARISQSFISTDDMQALIIKALDMAGKFMDMSKIVFARFEPAINKITFDHVWYNELEDVPFEEKKEYSFTVAQPLRTAFIDEKRTYIFSGDVRGQKEYEFLEKLGIKAFLSTAIYVSGEFWGYITMDKCEGPYEWTPSDIHLCEHIASIIAGVIERSATEEQLVRMSSIVESSPQFISFLNKNHEFEYVNPGVSATTLYSAEELMGISTGMLFDEDTFRKIREVYTPAAFAEGKVAFEGPIFRKDKVRREMSFSIFKTKLRKKDIGLGVIAVDITRTKEFQEQMLKAKEQAEQSSRAKSDFLSRMSHEMRTPMNAIIGMTSIAKSSHEIERIRYCLDKVDEASKHLLGVINDILDMSKIEANKFELSYEEFDFERMLQRVVNILNFRIDERNQDLIVTVGKNVPDSIVSDEQRLAQVITNLLSNAVKFTPEGGTIMLDASLEDEADGKCTLRISVTDTGIGISAEQQKRLFQSFEQADGGVSRKFGGTGLGLAISRSIVEMMGGRIWVESEEGKGSAFIFTIETQRGAAKRKLPDFDWKHLRVLVADDSPEVLEYFKDLSETMGFACELAGDGFEACELIDKNRDSGFDVVFVDWKMPGMNGLELTRWIRVMASPETVVILISATEWSEIEEEARRAGVNKFVPKPLFASTIVDSLINTFGAGNKNDTAESDIGIFRGYRILLAEDMDINREIVLALLAETEIEIDCAENGQIALDMFREREGTYDMIFMDIHMPELDGYEATRRIRALGTEKAANVPIVAMTANVFREDIEHCHEVGMNDHIGKPVNIEEIIAKLKKHLPER